MPSYYGSGTSGGGGGSRRATYTPAPIESARAPRGGGGSSDDGSEGGKFTIDLTDLGGSFEENVQSLGEYAEGVGSIGIEGGPNLGGVAGALGAPLGIAGEALGAVGGIGLPYLGNDPDRQAATVGDIPGQILDIVSLPGRAIERTVAGQRVEQAAGKGGPLSGLAGNLPSAIPFVGDAFKLADLADPEGAERSQALPPDLQERLDNGESVDVIADALVERGAGFSSDLGRNVAAQIAFDPLNIIAPGVSKAAQGVKGAGVAVQSVDDVARLGLPTRLAGSTYNAAARNMSGAGAALVDKVIGPVTSGALHTLGTRPLASMRSGFGRLDRGYAVAIEDAVGAANAQLLNAVIADEMTQDIAAGLLKAGDDIDSTLAARLTAKRTYKPEELERRAEELLARTAPDFGALSPDELAEATAKRMALVTGSSVEDAARVLGNKVDRQTAQTAHWAVYGKAGNELAAIKESLAGQKVNIAVDRLTLVSDRTLTTAHADALLAGDQDLVDAVNRFDVLSNHFLGKRASDGEILAFIKKLKDQGALTETVKAPKSRRNPLPSALGEWRQKYLDLGYDLGFAPKDGWKVVKDDDGIPIMVEPFVHFTSAVDPVTARNPLGRFMDSLVRGTTQTTIVQQSRQRMVDFMGRNDMPIAPNQTRAIHKAIIDEAAERGVTPRALRSERVATGSGETRKVEPLYDAIFRRFLSDDEFTELAKRYDPAFIVMNAFKGNWKTVGLTQTVSGAVKHLPFVAEITEAIYPRVRFTFNPLFQAQELIESPFFNALRGIQTRALDPDVADVYKSLAELPEFKYMTEAGYFLNIAGHKATRQFMGADTKVGRALGRFSNVQARKTTRRVSQVLSEHGEEFRDAVRGIDPKFWARMEEAYGTSDPRAIADAFLTERMALAKGEDEALAVFDGARALGDDAASETVWQAFRDSFRESSRQAFKTHYFNPQRGWLERTINHPYLGIYPASYMWGKVLPEFARFLLKRPFGIDAPLVGYAATTRVQQAFLGAMADDPEFRDFLDENKDAFYLANLLIPGQPTNLPANAPAWTRHIAEDLAAGRDVTATTVAREAADTTSYAFGPLHTLTTTAKAAADLGSIGEDIFESIQKAASQYDGQFGATAAP